MSDCGCVGTCCFNHEGQEEVHVNRSKCRMAELEGLIDEMRGILPWIRPRDTDFLIDHHWATRNEDRIDGWLAKARAVLGEAKG